MLVCDGCFTWFGGTGIGWFSSLGDIDIVQYDAGDCPLCRIWWENDGLSQWFCGDGLGLIWIDIAEELEDEDEADEEHEEEEEFDDWDDEELDDGEVADELLLASCNFCL